MAADDDDEDGGSSGGGVPLPSAIRAETSSAATAEMEGAGQAPCAVRRDATTPWQQQERDRAIITSLREELREAQLDRDRAEQKLVDWLRGACHCGVPDGKLAVHKTATINEPLTNEAVAADAHVVTLMQDPPDRGNSTAAPAKERNHGGGAMSDASEPSSGYSSDPSEEFRNSPAGEFRNSEEFRLGSASESESLQDADGFPAAPSQEHPSREGRALGYMEEALLHHARMLARERNRRAEASARREEAEARWRAAQEEAEGLRREELERQVREREEQVERTRGEKEELEGKTKVLEVRCTALRGEVEEKNELVKSLTTSMADREAKMERLRAGIEEKEGRVRELEGEMTTPLHRIPRRLCPLLPRAPHAAAATGRAGERAGGGDAGMGGRGGGAVGRVVGTSAALASVRHAAAASVAAPSAAAASTGAPTTAAAPSAAPPLAPAPSGSAFQVTASATAVPVSICQLTTSIPPPHLPPPPPASPLPAEDTDSTSLTIQTPAVAPAPSLAQQHHQQQQQWQQQLQVKKAEQGGRG
ncbi:hypothetical protein CLOP_g13197 [Closterium sp. NIES-67]|nr:hypothetical protein CLOP_g13197 [Closterium sp. NIES-67]